MPPKPEVATTPEMRARFARITSGTLAIERFRRGFRQHFPIGVRPLSPRVKPFAGEAFTMRFIPTREDIDTYATLTPAPNDGNLQWVGVEQIWPGQVLVIDSRGDPRAASAGNILCTRLAKRGGVGIVTDGSLRDGAEIAEMDLPAYAAEVVASTRLSYHHVADLQVPIGCAGVAVYPGDVRRGRPRRHHHRPAPRRARDPGRLRAARRLRDLPRRAHPPGRGALGRLPPDRPDPRGLRGLAGGGRPMEDVGRIRAPNAAAAG